ncbi:LacI family DNA-binding transcriptional regulator, partial [Xanthomonas fragariae]|uniref:LacI family DNA-binding transcriptional regulator n=1 Tax=Xanthomonas fragariae TaxID=48664 RepID=UPI00131F04B4
MHAHVFPRNAYNVTHAKPTPDVPDNADARRVRRGAVTLRDIAGAIGVSRATVSLVLRGSPLVHATTRARVVACT